MMLDYAHTYPYAKISYHAKYMILHVKSDAAYFVMSGACSHISGHYYLSCHPTNPTNPSYINPNQTILTECMTLGYLISSAEES